MGQWGLYSSRFEPPPCRVLSVNEQRDGSKSKQPSSEINKKHGSCSITGF